MPVLVIGATGTIGSAVVRLLLEKKQDVVALVRNQDKAAEQLGHNVKYVVGDVSHLAEVERAVQGVSKVFLLTVSSPVQAIIEEQVAKAAKKAGVSLLVKISVYGSSLDAATNDLMLWHAQSEKKIVETGIPFVFLRPNLFMQNLLRDAQTIKQGLIYRPRGDYSISHVDTNDIAEMAVTILTGRPGDYIGRTFWVNGPESLSYAQVAEVFSRVLDKPIALAELDDADYYEATKKHVPEPVAMMLVKLFQTYRTGIASYVHGDQKIVTKKQPSSLEAFIIANKYHFT